MYISYFLNIPSGPAITLTLFGCFLLTLLFSPSQGGLTVNLRNLFDQRN
ncbi:hypothetical protein IQ260_04960 [Leptolyngbya cf. ectocarpi LEGE 11479]|uniref:Uncharacterized protein n=2 Tax=Leptolyngbya ectocarpi TaxID=1202 RepID=A0A928ZSC2_LEPEC|nr:hypothetical protein [Leptolyngbya cf. ectocarpi LEGE 11479]